MKDIALIKQLDDTGCGIACVAMCLKDNYQQVKELFAEVLEWGDRKKKFYTWPSEITKVLNHSRVKYSSKQSSSWCDVEGTCIVGVNRSGRYWHWVVVVKDNKRFLVLDPATGEIFQHSEWEGDFLHSNRESTYYSFGKAASVVHI